MDSVSSQDLSLPITLLNHFTILLNMKKHIIIETNSWKVFLNHKQSYFGRCIIVHKKKARSLSELTDEDWNEFKIIIRKLENAYKKAFKAKMFNLTCLMNNAYKSKKPYVMMGHVQTFFEEIPVYCDIWLSGIVKNKVKGKVLCPKEEFVKVAKNEELRYMPKELTSLISTWIYGDKTAQFIMATPAYVVLIKNKEVAKSNMKIFDLLWKQAKK